MFNILSILIYLFTLVSLWAEYNLLTTAHCMKYIFVTLQAIMELCFFNDYIHPVLHRVISSF